METEEQKKARILQQIAEKTARAMELIADAAQLAADNGIEFNVTLGDKEEEAEESAWDSSGMRC